MKTLVVENVLERDDKSQFPTAVEAALSMVMKRGRRSHHTNLASCSDIPINCGGKGKNSSSSAWLRMGTETSYAIPLFVSMAEAMAVRSSQDRIQSSN